MSHRLTPLAESLPASVPFVGPEAQERARSEAFRARLGANESVFGPSPKVIEAVAQTDHWKYGDPESYDLREALASHLAIGVDNICIGEGIDALLGNIVRLMIAPGDAVVTSAGAYPTFNYHVAGFGGTLHQVPYLNDHEDMRALFAKAAEVDAKLVYLANPDNPMGTWWTGAQVSDALDLLPKGTLLILDEAYIECAPTGTAPPIDTDDDRVVRMRTFSKAYGMAGLRIGYAIGHAALVAAFNKVRNHFGVSRAAQNGALAALQDEAHLSAIQTMIVNSRNAIAKIARDHGLNPVASATNFVAIDCGSDGAFAQRVLANLIERGVFVRMPFVAPQNRCIRVSCGTEDDLAILREALPAALQQARFG